MEKIYRVKLNSKGMPNFATAEEIPQGEWVLISEVASNLGHKCSNCGKKAKKIVARSVLVDNYYCNKAEPITEYTHKEQLSKFCPNCGAKMKGADNE